MKSYKSEEQGREWWRQHYYQQVKEQELLKEAEKRLSERYLAYPPDYPRSLLSLASSDRSLISLSLSAASCLLSLSF